jgi:sugar lactone lactonase
MTEAEQKSDPNAGKTFLIELAGRGRFDPPVRL